MRKRSDIRDRKDVAQAVSTFYSVATKDAILQEIFDRFIQKPMADHLEVITDFWQSIVFGVQTYRGNPMDVHFAINKHYPLEKKHFDRWLLLWNETINAHFEGPNAELMKQRALNIGLLMQQKIQYQNTLHQ